MGKKLTTSADEAISEANDTYIRMARDAHENGREIPMVPVPRDAPMARESCEATTQLMRASRRRVFSMPDLPWKRGEKNAANH